jgi:hypothetical protein
LVVNAAPSSSPEELLSQLALDVPVPAACIPAAVRVERPRLDAVARRLSIETSDQPLGHEDLVCLLADTDAAEVVAQVDRLVAALRNAPFVLLIAVSPDAPDAAIAAGREVLATRHGWVMRDANVAAGPALLAPAWRFLDAPGLAGHWYGRSGEPAAELGDQDDLLTALWTAAERDRQALAAIAHRLASPPGGDPGTGPPPMADLGFSGLPLGGPRSELDRLRLERLEERAWVAQQARRIAASTSWRLGHRVIRVVRSLTFRRDRGTNLPVDMAERMEEASR